VRPSGFPNSEVLTQTLQSNVVSLIQGKTPCQRGGRSLQTGTVMSRRRRLALGIGQGLVDDLI
jgi:hypothetical protein